MTATEARGGFRGTVRDYLPDLIYGANDGVVTTLAVMAGVVGADLAAPVILVLGFANLFADGLSMAASNVLSQRSRAVDPPTLRAAARNGAATFVGFVGAGLVPLLAYLAPLARGERFPAAAGLALATLFAVGAGRAYFTPRHWLRAGAEMLLIGAAAGGVAYAVGVLGARWLDGIGGSD
jgi:VIT1/CCC1 family predicted Fe2+/Mn2+ transporter